ncbi:hypothetical protein GCM10027063_15630 [Promicromonospora xylanilytica]
MVGLIAAKLFCLGFAGLLGWAVAMIVDDGELAGWFLGPIVGLAAIFTAWMGLFLFNRHIVERLRPANRFHRLGRSPGRPRNAEREAESAPAPGRQRTRTRVLLALSVPALLILVHILSAYVEELTSGGRFRWLAWGYQGIAIDPLFYVTDRWPVPVLIVLGISLASLIALLWTGLRTAGRRLRARRRARLADRAALPELPDLPERVLRSAPRGQADLLRRAGLFLPLGLPAAYLLGYCLLAYLAHLWSMVTSPVIDEWAWNAPENFGAFGEWFFTEEWMTMRVLALTLSVIFLSAGIALAVLAVPLLVRRGADAIDLAVTETGVVVRGGLAIGWDEIAEVLVVRDTRITSWSGARRLRAPGQPRSVLNPTYIAGHSRTRIALVLRDLPDVATRSSRSQRRALRADHTGAYGYALCDLWVHSADEVSTSLASLQKRATRERVPVTNLERVTSDSMPEGTPRWFSALFVR